jgi:hypothetical protein
MKRLLQVVGLGVIIWGVSLVWPLVNLVLTSRVADAIVVGLVVAVSAYFLGRSFTQPSTKREEGSGAGQTPEARPTRPSAPIIYPFRRTPRSTRPIPQLVAPDFHARVTRPVSAIVGRAHHSRITEPVPIVR